jgi:hypothetical protein
MKSRGAFLRAGRAGLRILATLVLTGGVPCVARAQSMEPRSYVNAPVGLNFLIAGYTHQWGSVLLDPALSITNARVSVDAAAVAYSRFIDCWGHSGSVALALPYAWISASGDVQEQSRSVSRNGIGDADLRISVNLYGAPALSRHEFTQYHQDTILGVTLRVDMPTGHYDAIRLINVGNHRWAFRPELGVSKALGPVTLEAAAGAAFFTDNDQFLGNKVRHQDPLYSMQGHAIYNFGPDFWAALDGTYYTGGRTSLNGRPDNNLEHNSRWGATLARSIDARNSIKLIFTSGLSVHAGSDFKSLGIFWQHRWFDH